MVVDAQVDDHVGEAGVAAVALDDEQAGRLLPAPVAARRLRRREAVEEPLRRAARPRDASNVSAIASTVSRETRMLPCAA